MALKGNWTRARRWIWTCTNCRAPVAFRIYEVDRGFVSGDEATVGVGRGRANPQQRRRMRQQAANVIPRQFREPGVSTRIGKQVLLIPPQALVDMHPRAIVLKQRLWHKGRRLAVGARDVLDDILVHHE